jgi:hypothetical protein
MEYVSIWGMGSSRVDRVTFASRHEPEWFDFYHSCEEECLRETADPHNIRLITQMSSTVLSTRPLRLQRRNSAIDIDSSVGTPSSP